MALIDMIKNYQALLDRKDDLSEQTKANNAAIEAAKAEITQQMVDEDIPRISTGGYCFKGKALSVKFYEGASDHLYTPAKPWECFMEMRADIIAMCRMLSYRGLPAADLLLGTQTADAILQFDDLQRLLDKNSGIAIGAINEQLSAYTGVVFLGTINFGGFRLNLISVDESYEDDAGRNQSYFPVDEAMVTAPGCGHLMYGQITQIDFGSTEYTSHPGVRVPKFTLDQDKDMRKLRLASRPLSAPRNYCPFIRGKKVVA